MQPQLQNNHSPTTGAVHEVPQINGLDFAPNLFVEQYQKPGFPVVITDLLDLKALWSIDQLCDNLGQLEFPVRHYGRERYTQDKRQWTSTGSGVAAQTMTFQQYVELLQNGKAYAEDLYLARCSLNNTPLAEAPLFKQAEAKLGLHSPATALNLWLCPSGHTSCLHYDPMDGTLIQLHGSKRVILFPPSQLYSLYPFSVLNQLRHGLKIRSGYSQVYPDRPDFEAFPRFWEAQQHRYEVILRSGEILFIPSGWWHEVTAQAADPDTNLDTDPDTDIVCSVNRFWHVYPLVRSLRLWSKWRVHLGSVLATPHILGTFLQAAANPKRGVELRKLLQKL